MNRIELMGTLVEEPKQTATKTGSTFALFSLKVGDHVFKLCAFGAMRTRINSILPGSVVSILGELSQRQYTDKLGVQRENLNVYVKDLSEHQILTEKKQEETKADDFGDIPF